MAKQPEILDGMVHDGNVDGVRVAPTMLDDGRIGVILNVGKSAMSIRMETDLAVEVARGILAAAKEKK